MRTMSNFLLNDPKWNKELKVILDHRSTPKSVVRAIESQEKIELKYFNKLLEGELNGQRE